MAEIKMPNLMTLADFSADSFNNWKLHTQFVMKGLYIWYTCIIDYEDWDPEGNSAEQWDSDADYARDLLLNSLCKELRDTHIKFKTPKEIWDSLETKFQKDEQMTKVHLVDQFLSFTFSDEGKMSPQVSQLEALAVKLREENRIICDRFLTDTIIFKLPSTWNDFKMDMYRRRSQIELEDLKRFINIEDRVRAANQNGALKRQRVEANMVSSTSGSRKPKKQRLNEPSQTKLEAVKKVSKKGGKCYNCGKWGHYSNVCTAPKTTVNQPAKKKEKVNAVINEAGPSNFIAMINSKDKGSSSDWWLDSGATCHVTNNRDQLTNMQKVEETIEVADGNTVRVTERGIATLNLSSGKILTLKNVKYVPRIARNLISLSLLDEAGMVISFSGNRVTLSVNSHFFGFAYLANGMYRLSLNTELINTVTHSPVDIVTWHHRFGHVNYKKLMTLIKDHNLPLTDSTSNEKCEVCARTKITRKPFKSVSRSTQLLDLIHSDICDFKSFMTRGGKKYLITFIDDYSRYCHVYLLKSKDEALNKFKEFKERVENKLNRKIKRFRSDRGGEYTASAFREFCVQHGIICETTAPYSPQSNGIAERKNRTLQEMLNSMILTAGVPTSFWGEAVLTANHILNRVPQAKLDTTPFELWFGFKPRFHDLKTWGCIAYVRLSDLKRPKVGSRTTTCIYLGCAEDSSAYRFLDLASNTVIESRDAEFFENKFLKDKGLTIPVAETDLQNTETNDETESELRRFSSRERIPRSFGEDFVTYNVEADPTTFREALRSRDSDIWIEAINDEMDSLLQNKTWTLVNLPTGAKTMGSKWVLKKKLNPDGSIAKYKARLVAKGYTQEKGIDFFDVYSPVCHIATIRVLLAVASIEKYVIHQMDVKTAFLNGELDEEIYMSQPEGFVIKGSENKVCKLIKSLYGLKQAPKLWHAKFDTTVKNLGFIDSTADKCLYFRCKSNKAAIICLYVDDMLVLGSDESVVKDVKDCLAKEFSMKDLGVVDTILGIRVGFRRQGITLSQSHYIGSILNEYGYSNCKPIETPIDCSKRLTPHKGEAVDQAKYAKIIGSLMYAMTCIRPDIAYAVGMLSSFTSNPSKEHWIAINMLMRYLKGTSEHSLCYTGNPQVVEGYSDASWCSDTIDCRSTSGFVYTLGGAAIIWKSKRQTVIASSSMESELHALASAADEAEWVKNLILDIPRQVMKISAVGIYCDNQAARIIAMNNLFNGKKRTIRLKQAVVNSLIKKGVITLIDVRSHENLADLFTKGLKRETILKGRKQMGLCANEEMLD